MNKKETTTSESKTIDDATVSIEDMVSESSGVPQSCTKVQFQLEVTTINNESKKEEDEAKLQAEALFKQMKADAESEGNALNQDFGSLLTLHDDDVDDIAKEHYNKQINMLKTEKMEHDQEMNQEIDQLKQLLASTQFEAAKAMQDKQNRPVSRERKDPYVQPVTLNGVRSKLLVCNFQASKGRIGISFKRYGNQFFIVDITKGTQADEYKGIGPGLLLYQTISAVPGSDEGMNISVSHSEELARAVLAEFGKGRQIQMSFLILPENIPVQNIHQHVLKASVPRYNPSTYRQRNRRHRHY